MPNVWTCPVCGYTAQSEVDKQEHLRMNESDPEHQRIQEQHTARKAGGGGMVGDRMSAEDFDPDFF